MARRHRLLKHAGAEAAQFRVRAAIGFAMVVLALGGLGLWYFKLQVIDHADYATRSEANRIKPRPVIPGRGLILDRKGRVLADNVPAYRLDVTPEQAGEVFTRTKPKLAVYSHIVLPNATEQDLIPPTRRTYSGPLELGEDLSEVGGVLLLEEIQQIGGRTNAQQSFDRVARRGVAALRRTGICSPR